jgi:hypothetical protein
MHLPLKLSGSNSSSCGTPYWMLGLLHGSTEHVVERAVLQSMQGLHVVYG